MSLNYLKMAKKDCNLQHFYNNSKFIHEKKINKIYLPNTTNAWVIQNTPSLVSTQLDSEFNMSNCEMCNQKVTHDRQLQQKIWHFHNLNIYIKHPICWSQLSLTELCTTFFFLYSFIFPFYTHADTSLDLVRYGGFYHIHLRNRGRMSTLTQGFRMNFLCFDVCYV